MILPRLSGLSACILSKDEKMKCAELEVQLQQLQAGRTMLKASVISQPNFFGFLWHFSLTWTWGYKVKR